MTTARMRPVDLDCILFCMVRVTPEREQSLSAWIEASVHLPAGVTAEPGPSRLYPYQRGIAAAIGDPKIERVTVIKSARVGYTATMTAGLAHFIVRDPAPILKLSVWLWRKLARRSKWLI